MNKDLLTATIAAILGVLIAFFITDYFLGPVESVTYTTVNSTVNTAVAEPDPEIFNYRALNPTVEVYVGGCAEYNQFNECIESQESQEPQEPQESQELQEDFQDDQATPEIENQETE